ncbi:MAG: septal ring lytic transglycosylase RlpA family protein [Gammaproteobacteria bacterium]
MNKKIWFKWVVVTFCFTQLAACSFLHGGGSGGIDGAPKYDIDVYKIHDAVPKKESLSRYGNKSYSVRGHYYKVLSSAKGYDKYGVASWYGTMFHGKLTSSREPYNLYAMTAASPILPLPCYVQVTNTENGKKAVVKVTDRGPFERNRIMDFSYAAAKKLGFANEGTAHVHIVAIDPDNWNKNHSDGLFFASAAAATFKPQPTKSTKQQGNQKSATNKKALLAENTNTYQKQSAASKPKFYLQIGAFSSLASAKKVSNKVEALLNTETHVSKVSKNNESVYRVQIGPVLSNAESSRLRNTLKTHGFDKVIAVAQG